MKKIFSKKKGFKCFSNVSMFVSCLMGQDKVFQAEDAKTSKATQWSDNHPKLSIPSSPCVAHRDSPPRLRFWQALPRSSDWSPDLSRPSDKDIKSKQQNEVISLIFASENSWGNMNMCKT